MGKIKAGSKKDKMMENKMGIEPGTMQDKQMEAGMMMKMTPPMVNAIKQSRKGKIPPALARFIAKKKGGK